MHRILNDSVPAMTFPKLDSDWLIAAPSFNLSPVAPVDSARSLFTTKTYGVNT